MLAAAPALPSVAITEGSAARPRSWAHALALLLVAVTIALSGVVFSEPAPVDALTIGLIVLLPTIGLVAINPGILAYLALWTVTGAGAVLAAALSLDTRMTLIHVGVTLYLYLGSVVFAAFVAKNPARHTELILKAWTFAALVAAAAALVGYFGLLPGAYDLFTRFGRAAGTFKDPNVLGPFLVPPLVYLLHVAIRRSSWHMLVPLAAVGILGLTVLVTFSRGAWINLGIAVGAYAYLSLLTSERAVTRLKITGLLMIGALFAVAIVGLALQSDYISGLLVERSSLAMEYDTGEEGRFGGQEKALEFISENPLGLGAQQFATHYHPEEVHNVYLNMMLNAGWLGGGAYFLLVVLTLALGLRHALKRAPTQPLFIVAYAAFVAVALEGAVIDSDHWRHFFLLMAIIWGMMCARPVATPASPPRRSARILGRARIPQRSSREISLRRPTIITTA